MGSALSASPDANILLDARMPGIDGFETARLIRHEENALAQALGEHFSRYCKVTRRWLPRWSNHHEPESWIINPRRFRSGLLDAMWFLWAFMPWEIFEEFGVLPSVRQLIKLRP